MATSPQPSSGSSENLKVIPHWLLHEQTSSGGKAPSFNPVFSAGKKYSQPVVSALVGTFCPVSQVCPSLGECGQVPMPWDDAHGEDRSQLPECLDLITIPQLQDPFTH